MCWRRIPAPAARCLSSARRLASRWHVSPRKFQPAKLWPSSAFLEEPRVDGYFVKEAVLPFRKFPGADARLSPEMRSTGEVMGHASNFGHAFIKAQIATGVSLPTEGVVAFSVSDEDKGEVATIARDFLRMGFELAATAGTAQMLELVGIPVRTIRKVEEDSPTIVDLLRSGEIALVITTPH